jgi:hypothetical protein
LPHVSPRVSVHPRPRALEHGSKPTGPCPLLPLLHARAGRAWCATSDPAAVTVLRNDARLLATGSQRDNESLQAYLRLGDLSALLDD